MMDGRIFFYRNYNEERELFYDNGQNDYYHDSERSYRLQLRLLYKN